MRDRLGRLGAFLAVAGAAIIAYALVRVVYALPPPARAYVALSIVAGALVACGFVLLIGVIPAFGSLNPDLRTEFLSSRAAYLCVVAGLVLFGVITIGAVFARVVLTLGGL